MESREQIFETLSELLHEMFEIDTADISLSSSFRSDLDIDSIDALDLMAKLHEITGKRIKPEEFKSVVTMGDVVEAVYKLIHE